MLLVPLASWPGWGISLDRLAHARARRSRPRPVPGPRRKSFLSARPTIARILRKCEAGAEKHGQSGEKWFPVDSHGYGLPGGIQ
jgi:hypothetical protein